MLELGSHQENMQHLESLGCNTNEVMVSGGRLINFKEGWALGWLGFSKAHYYKSNHFGHYPTLCGGLAAAPSDPNSFYAQGSFEACKNCIRIAKLRGKPLPKIQPAKESST